MAHTGKQSIAPLLVDDDPASGKRLRHHLRDEAFRFETPTADLTRVETVAAGHEALAADDYDVVLLSLGVEASEGLTALDRFLDGGSDAPVVVLTEGGGHDLGERAVGRGAQDFLVTDSLDGDRLWRAIRYAVERHDQVRELERQNDRLEFFTAVLRHDLLNGMNVIRGRGQLLGEYVDDDGREHLDTLLEWTDSLVDLTERVQAVLETVTAGDERERRPVDLAAVVEDEAERVRGLADGVTVIVDVPADATVRADDLLADVVGNLLTNAVEHNDPEGLTVTVSAAVDGDSVTLSVADDGSGLPETGASSLFERGESGTASDGSGFGLHFVSVMAETYGGDVRATGRDDGGAEFVLTLPAARPAESPTQ